MTLSEAIAERDENEILYIGCEEGSGFFFVGTPAEYELYIDVIDLSQQNHFISKINRRQEAIDENTDKLSEAMYEAKQAAEKEQEELEEVKALFGKDHVPSYKAAKAEKHHIGAYEKATAAQNECNRLDNQIKHDKSLVRKYTDMLRKWTPFRDRDVIENYEHTAETEGYTFLIDGISDGEFWFRSEFEKWMKRNPIKEEEKK